MKGMSVGYDVGCTMGLTLGHSAWQINRPSNGSMWNSYSFQPVGQWMGCLFSDLGAEGCCHCLNALFSVINTKFACFPFNRVWELGRPSGYLGAHVGSPDQVMGRIWRLGDHLSTVLLQGTVVQMSKSKVFRSVNILATVLTVIILNLWVE